VIDIKYLLILSLVQSIFTLLALLVRRHVAKMHLCLSHEFDPMELWNDMDTVTWVVEAVRIRFLDLKGSAA
jgi:hypothetical protein